MHTGHVISGAGHLGLIGWLLLAGWLEPAQEPFEMTQVSVISGAEFDTMMAGQQPPEQVTEVALPATPQTVPDTPELSSTPDEAIEQPAPLQTEAPVDDQAPDVTDLAPPPDAEVADTPPELAEPPSDIAVLVPEVAPEAVPRPVERVAPEPVAQPDPEATPDPIEQEAIAPDAEGEAPQQEAQEATSPEEATTEVVTEATQAPAASTRPPGRRPTAPVRQAETQPAQEVETEAPAPQTETSGATDNSDVEAAVQAALEAAAAPSGPPLSAGEKEALRVAVSQCWNIGSLSTEALGTTVIVGVEMKQDGTPVTNSIRLLSSSGGSNASAQRVFDSARRAIIRCGARGFALPTEKYSQWRNIEMTFDPRKMGF